METSLGRDSNVNAAATADGLFVPLASVSREGDGYLEVGAGATLSRAIDRNTSLFAGADIRKRGHFDRDDFDFLSADLRLGAQAGLSEKDLLRFALEHEEYERERDGVRRTHGLTAQWSRRLEPRTQISAFAQALRIRYRQQALASESSDMFLAGAQATRAFGRVVAAASVYSGQDEASAGRADGDRALVGLGATFARRLAPRVEADAALSYLRSDYQGSDREDRYVAVELGLLWRVTPAWTVRPQISRAHNRSNRSFGEFGRTEASVSLRWLWGD